MTCQDARCEVVSQDDPLAERRREFKLKLAAGLLPTLERQHRWHPAAYPSPACCRCTTGEAETWDHLLNCPGNAGYSWRSVRTAAEEAVMEAVGSIKQAREEAEEKGKALVAGEVAFAAVPKHPSHDVGFLLGAPSQQTSAALGRLGLRMSEIAQVAATATAAALDALWSHI